MILQALNGYYERLLTDPEVDISEFGFGRQGVHFALTLDRNGTLVGRPLDLRDEKGRPRRTEVPGPAVRTVGVVPNFAWDNTGYVLGADEKGKPERTAQTHAAFKALATTVLDGVDDAGAAALRAFLAGWNPEQAAQLPEWETLVGQNVVFMLDGEPGFLHDRAAFRRAWVRHLEAEGGGEQGMCLITGQTAPIPPTHAKIKGVAGAQTSGASLISFNFDAAKSFGKEQNLNAPVSERAAFAYTTALNHLLAPESPRKLRVGDTTVVFWTEARGQAEKFFNFAMGGKHAEDDDQARRLEGYLSAVAKGKYPEELGDATTPFYVLGLSPNAARLSVRFWHVGTVGGIAERIGQYYSDQELDHNYTFTKYPSIKSLFYALAPYRKDKDTNRYKAAELTQSTEDRCSSVVNDFLLSVLNGERYPKQLFNMVLQRLRKDTCTDGFNGFVRLAFLKAYLIQSKQEVPVSLDSNSKEYGYVLGRLFATVENIQRAASKTELNTTLRDRYFTGAMSSPSRVFVPLIQNAFDNLPKLRKSESGLYGYFEKTLNEIMNKIEISDGLKHTLKPEEQGQFVIGYFHQRSFKKDKNTEG
jgi:CRISPR-associated protein Csd1